MRRYRPMVFCAFVSAVLLVSPVATSGADDDAAFRQALDEGMAALQAGKNKRAAKLFARADALADGRSVDALLALATAQVRAKRWTDAHAAARRVAPMADTPAQQAAALNLLGLSLANPKRASEADLQAAADAWRQVLDLQDDPSSTILQHLVTTLTRTRTPEKAIPFARQALAAGDLPATSEDAVRLTLCGVRRQLEGPPDPGTAATFDQAFDPTHPDGVMVPAKAIGEAPVAILDETYVAAWLHVDSEGCVVNVTYDHPEQLDPADQRILQKTYLRWVFRPATLAGVPIGTRYRIVINKTVT